MEETTEAGTWGIEKDRKVSRLEVKVGTEF